MKRTYDRTLREAQAQQTRSAIIEAALALVAEDEHAPLSFPRVAERAKVSEPTVYRYFPNRDALLAALSAHLGERLRGPSVPEQLEDLPASAVATAQYFSENPQMLRAAMRSGVTREIREHGRRGRVDSLRELLEGSVAHLERKDAEAVQALFATVLRGETWLELTERHQVDSERAGFALAWAVRALLEALARDRKKGLRTLSDEKLRARAAGLREVKTKGSGR